MSVVVPGMMLITESTDTAHVVTPDRTLCGRWYVETEWLDEDYDFGGAYGKRLVHDYSVRVLRSCDGSRYGSIDGICQECDGQMPYHEYRDLYHTHHFAYIDGVDIGAYQSGSMSSSQWRIYLASFGY